MTDTPTPKEEAMSRAGCPLGDDCDLTVAWMAGASRARHEGWKAAIEAAARMVEPADSADEDVARILRMAAAAIRSLLRHEGPNHE